MKKITLSTLIFLTLLISACANTPPAAVAEPGAAPIVESSSAQKPATPAPDMAQKPTQTDSTGLSTDYQNAASVAMQLLLGTIKLEGTEHTVTAEQAATLTPLWTNFKSVSYSVKPQGEPGQGQQGQPNTTPQPIDSELQTQLDEIIKQIASAMTADQIKYIAAMQITQETAQTMMQEQGITMSGPQQGNGNAQGGGQGQPSAGGNMPQGTPPAGGAGGGHHPGGGQMGTSPANGIQPGKGMEFVPSELIDVVIKLLGQKK